MPGYLGNDPAGSATKIARQTYTTSGAATTDFTFTSGYDVGYLDVYVNGERQTKGKNFTASDGSTFKVLNGGVGTGSTVEAIAYKTFNLATVDFDDLGNTGNLTLTGDISGANATFTGDVSIGGTLTYEDVTNIDSVGIVTARQGIDIQGGIGATFADNVKAFFGTGGDLQIFHNANHSIINNSTGDLRLESDRVELLNNASDEFYLNADNGGAVNLYYNGNKKFETTSSGAIVTGIATVTSDVSIADKIVHTGDTNTAIRFPGNDTFAVETSGSEALRVDGGQRLLIGAISTRGTHGGGDAQLQIEGTNTATAGMSITRTSADAGSPTFSFGKTRNGSALSDGDDVGVIYWQGDDGTDLATALCSIKGEVDGSVSGNTVPGRITFNTATTSTNLTERLRITSAGQIRIPVNATSTSGKLQLGASQQLSIFQDSSNGYIANNDFIIANGDVSETLARFRNGGAVDLHHNNSKKLETSAAGVTVTGTLNATTDVTINGKSAATTGKAIAMAMLFG